MIELPIQCKVDKFIPKKTFYEKVNISNSIKQEFVDKIEKITWKYKIAENNINVSKTNDVEEIEIFEIILREKYNSKNILKIITKEIPYQILFVIKYKDEFQYAIKYNENIYFSTWNENIEFDFSDFNLEKVYENILKSIVNIDKEKEDLDKEIEKAQEIQRINKKIEKLENQIKKELQFNKKVELNQQLILLKNKKGELENNG